MCMRCPRVQLPLVRLRREGHSAQNSARYKRSNGLKPPEKPPRMYCQEARLYEQARSRTPVSGLTCISSILAGATVSNTCKTHNTHN